jgi:hypothetical protein
MTKNKLAKLAAKAQENNGGGQLPLPDDFDPIAMLNEDLKKCVGNNSLQVTEFGTEYSTQPPTLGPSGSPGFVSFDAAHDSDAMLRTQLEEFNMLHQPLPQQNPMPVAGCPPVANGEFVADRREFDLPAHSFGMGAGFMPSSTDATLYDPMAEIDRQALLDVDWPQWLNDA